MNGRLRVPRCGGFVQRRLAGGRLRLKQRPRPVAEQHRHGVRVPAAGSLVQRRLFEVLVLLSHVGRRLEKDLDNLCVP